MLVDAEVRGRGCGKKEEERSLTRSLKASGKDSIAFQMPGQGE